MAPRLTRLKASDKKALLRLCRQVIAVDSTNPTGTLELAEFFAEKFRRLGFAVKLQRKRFHGAAQANLIARAGPSQGSALVLNTHLDTVTTEPAAWTKTGGNPFRATLRRGRLYGLGAADTKAALACQWMALKSLGEVLWTRPLILTGSYGEEMGLVGADHLVEEGFFRNAQVLNTEPTELKLSIGNKGIRIYRVKFRARGKKKIIGRLYHLAFTGKAAHSARPHKGENALLMALRYLSVLPKEIQVLEIKGGLAANIVAPSAELKVLVPEGELPSPKKFRGRTIVSFPKKGTWVYPKLRKILKTWKNHLHEFRRGNMTQNLGILHLANGRGEMVLDLRIPPKASLRSLEKKLKACVKQCGGHLEILRDNRPFLTTRKTGLFKDMARILRSQGHPVGTEIKKGCTEASSFGPVAAEVLTFGPGRLYGVAHQPNEYVEVKQLEWATLIYRELFGQLC